LGRSFFHDHHQLHLVQLRGVRCLGKKMSEVCIQIHDKFIPLFYNPWYNRGEIRKGGKADMLYLPRDEGQGLVEYALILVLVAIVVIAILLLLGPVVGNVFSNIVSNL
jgi:pilus assembly protein Flp/PilA